MTIQKEKSGSKLTLKLAGRLDTTTSPELSEFLGNELEDVTELIFDFSELEYISSAGLRVILSTQKQMNKKGSMVIMHANDGIKETFEFTGFLDILTVVD